MTVGAGIMPIGPNSAMNPLSVCEQPIVGHWHSCAVGLALCSGYDGSAGSPLS